MCLAACLAACSAAGDAPTSGDAGLADAVLVDAPHDLTVDAQLPPYETLPPCTDAAFWELPPNYEARVSMGANCLTSDAQPLMPFSIHTWARAGDPRFERVCYRVTESRDAGWAVGAVIERDAGTQWEGYVAGRRPYLAYEMRVVFPGGRLTAVQPGWVASRGFIEFASEPEAITAVTSNGGYASAAGVRLNRDTVAPVSDLRALFTLGGYTAWIEPAGALASLNVSTRDGIERVTFDADTTQVRATEYGEWTTIALGAQIWEAHLFSGLVPSIAIRATDQPPFDAPPDQLWSSPTHPMLARLGNRVVAANSAEVVVEASSALLFASGVDAIIDGHRPHLLRGSMLVPVDYDWTIAPSVLRAREDQAFVLDPRIGEPLFVLEDGRVLGTEGIVGPPREQSPDFITSSEALGGPVVAFARAREGGWMEWGYAAVRRADEHVVLSFGEVHPDACGF